MLEVPLCMPCSAECILAGKEQHSDDILKWFEDFIYI